MLPNLKSQIKAYIYKLNTYLKHNILLNILTKENKFDEASKKLQKFTYETRVSSREFCKALTTNKIDFSKEDEKISNIIEDKNWFFKSWKKDPTIKSMLNMLDAIHEKFKKKRKSTNSIFQ